ncbi:hypothetical protein K402DRAFT_382705 [Aulographum hederae CBS 113979]|uniref:RED-like N-terminal domain-containing protein n=1 Tax=Aulographum hederae CBS 113979 TaxID=1176131 RepID=A0A6G1GRI7_9PEZI|nr:hypothetical protein K402DRAFT_382705 [Aulographum hederae CBS 113979]
MNNEQFRLLVSNTPRQSNASGATPRPSATPGNTLGSKFRPSIAMTPRGVRGNMSNEFARQMAERNAPKTARKFRSSAAPKGSKLAEGYRDRTKDRAEEEEDDREQRIKALEEAMKLGQIEQSTFEQLRDEITGGDINATHLVKGLDRKLLERIRRGEDVYAEKPTAEEKETVTDEDFDKAMDEFSKAKIVPVAREEKVKQGVMAPPPPVAGTKRRRADILAELKASRAAAKATPTLDSRFVPLGAKKATTRYETDEKGRDVIIVTDENGNVKRRVRKLKPEDTPSMPEPEAKRVRLTVDPNKAPLGIVVPKAPEPEEDLDIFEGVGQDWQPMAFNDEDDSSDSSDEDEEPKAKEKSKCKAVDKSESVFATKSPEPSAAQAAEPPRKRNYFNDKLTVDETNPANPLKDANLIAALKKASKIDVAALDPTSKSAKELEEEERLKRRAAMLNSASDRDFEDMDLGFGESRFGDAEEMEDEGKKVKLSKWRGTTGGDDDDDDEDGGKKGGAKRKRGGKKRKGDKNSAADVMQAIEKQKGGA